MFKMGDEIAIIGLGGMGTTILNFLSRTPGIKKIVVADLDEARGRATTDIATYGASQEGFYPSIRFVKTNLYDVDGTAEMLADIQPAVICHAATLAAWWARYSLPEAERRIYSEIVAINVPFYTALLYKLMQAVKKAGIKTHVVNCSYCDVVNPLLGKVGLAPTIGGGNVQNRIPRIKKIVSEKLKVPMRNVDVLLVAEHSWTEHPTVAPFWIKIIAEGDDVTDKFPKDKLMIQMQALDEVRHGPFTGVENKYAVQDIASAFLSNMLAIYFDTGAVTSAPGPTGMIGGYPVRLSRKGAELALPAEITMKEAVKINEEGARLEGVEQIKNGGTLVYTEKAHNAMRKLGLDWKEFSIEESEEKIQKIKLFFKSRGIEW